MQIQYVNALIPLGKDVYYCIAIALTFVSQTKRYNTAAIRWIYFCIHQNYIVLF